MSNSLPNALFYDSPKKKEMQAAVGKILNQEQKIKPDDAADALAIALTHAFTLCGGLSH